MVQGQAYPVQIGTTRHEDLALVVDHGDGISARAVDQAVKADGGKAVAGARLTARQALPRARLPGVEPGIGVAGVQPVLDHPPAGLALVFEKHRVEWIDLRQKHLLAVICCFDGSQMFTVNINFVVVKNWAAQLVAPPKGNFDCGGHRAHGDFPYLFI